MLSDSIAWGVGKARSRMTTSGTPIRLELRFRGSIRAIELVTQRSRKLGG